MRDDLLALGADALAKLANVGLVKRATAEVAAGRGPEVDEEPDGTVVGRSPDGAVTRIARGARPVLGVCSCGAAACRHRLATVLVYQRSRAAPAPPAAWDPGAVTDAALALAVPPEELRRATRARSTSLVAEVRPGSPPVVRLPASTVQFLVPHELAFARCDCARGSGCEHVALAVWAFRLAPAGGVVELGAPTTPSTAALARAEAACEQVVLHGVAHLPGAETLALARAAAESAGLAWLALALQDLERHKEWYDRSSARFDPRAGPRLVAEIASRVRAARGGPLPAGFVLGANEAPDTWIDTVRWVGLGAQLDADGNRRSAEVWLADAIDGSVLLARGEWAFEGDAPNGPALAQRFVSSRMSVASLVGAEVVVRGARRFSDGRCDLGTARSMKATPFRGAPRWNELPPSLRVTDLGALGSGDEVPPLLAPRRRGARIRVVEVAEVEHAGWSPGEQEAVVRVRDPAGTLLVLRSPWRTVALGAPAALLAAAPALKYVAGELRRRGGTWEMSPFGLATADGVVAPDLAPPGNPAAPEALPTEPDPIGLALAELREAVERAVHRGAGRVDAGPLAEQLAARGFPDLAARARRARPDGAGWLDLVVATAWAEELPR